MKDFYFTFANNQKDKQGNSLRKHFTVIQARDQEEAREIMLREYGNQWGFLYENAVHAGVEKYSLEYIEFEKLIGHKKKSEVTSLLF